MLKVVDDNKVWTLEISIGENPDETTAQARLRADDTETVGWGRGDATPTIPARLAKSCGCTGVGLGTPPSTAIADIEEFEGRPVHLHP
jgi:hypothetical protein